MNSFRTKWRAIVVALAATAGVAVLRRYGLVQFLGLDAPFMSFTLSIVIAAWLSGFVSGMLATVLGAAAGTYMFMDSHEVSSLPAAFQARIVFFVAIGLLISWGFESTHAMRRQLEERQRGLEERQRHLEHETAVRRQAETSERQQREQLIVEMKRREAAEQILRDNEERVRMAVESADIGTWDFNILTGERNWSERAKVMFGLPPHADVTDVSYLDRIHPNDRERVVQAVGRARDPRGNGRYETECRLVLPDGSVGWFIVKGQAFFEGQGEQRHATRLIGTVMEITKRKKAEEIIQASENRLQAIMDNAHAVIYLKDLDGRFLLINRRFEELLHVSQRDFIGKTDADIFPSDVVAKIQANDQLVRESGKPLEFEECVPQQDGPHTYVAVKFPLFDAGGHCVAVGGISTDITDRQRAIEALETEQEMLRHTIQMQDQERQLVAYDIHDGLVQYATGALMQLEGIKHQLASEVLAEKIERILEILRKTVSEGRRIINGMHTTILDDCGVVAAVQGLIEDKERSHLEVEFVKDEALGRMASNIELALFHITRESLTNVTKHSCSNKVRIQLGRYDDRVRLEVRDWGVGFASATKPKGVHGLKGMIERARIAGGRCTFESAPGQGTQVVVDLPYQSRASTKAT